MSAPTGIWQAFDFDSLYMQQILNDDDNGKTLGNVYRSRGASEFGLDPEMLTATNYGDAQILDYFSRIKSAKVAFKVVVLDLTVMAAMFGANIITQGSSPNRQMLATYGTNPLPYFTLDGQCKYTGPFNNPGQGDGHLKLSKGIVSKYSWKLTAEKYHEISGEIMALPQIYVDPTFKNYVFQFVENETAQTLSATTYTGAVPSVASVSPASAATAVDVDVAPVITFVSSGTAPLNPATVTKSTVLLINTFATPDVAVPCNVSLDDTGFIVTLTPVSPLSSGNVYDILVTQSVRDIYGNQPAAVTVSGFTTAS